MTAMPPPATGADRDAAGDLPIEPVLRLAREGAEAVDRGQRGLAPEVAALADAGLLAAALPRRAGGRGWGTEPLGADALGRALFALGGASLPLARLFEGHVNAVRLVDRLGTPAQRAGVAGRVAAGALLGVWGANGAPPTTARWAGTGWTLGGRKRFCSGLGLVDVALVTAAAEDGERLFMVDARAADRLDVRAWDAVSMVGSASGGFDCEGLALGPEAALGPPGALVSEPDFHGGLWRLCACHAGAMDAIARGLTAKLAGGLADEPRQRQRVALIAMEAQTAALWSDRARALAEADGAGREAVAAALFAREAIEGAAQRQRDLVERAMGTALHLRGSSIGRLLRDLHFFIRQAVLDAKLDSALAALGDAEAAFDGGGAGRDGARLP